MDFSKFRTPDWLMIGGGLGFLIFGTFFDWIKVSFQGFSASDGNAFDFFFTGVVPWILIVGTGVIAFLLAARVMKPGTAPWPLILLLATAVGTLLVLIRFIAPGIGEDLDGVDVGRAIGLWLSTLSAIVATAGAVMNFTSTGGDLKDLTDMGKMRSAFNRPSARGDDAPPPPAPPPPPPPVP